MPSKTVTDKSTAKCLWPPFDTASCDLFHSYVEIHCRRPRSHLDAAKDCGHSMPKTAADSPNSIDRFSEACGLSLQ